MRGDRAPGFHISPGGRQHSVLDVAVELLENPLESPLCAYSSNYMKLFPFLKRHFELSFMIQWKAS